MPIRPLRRSDAPALLYQVSRNREYLAPWEPARDDSYYTSYDIQLAVVDTALQEQEAGRRLALAIVDDRDELVGQVTINSIIRGALQSGSLGYWVSAWNSGRGLATAAVKEAVELAFTQLDLHRLQAEILVHNSPSEAVLRRNGFSEYGFAPSYMKIAGRWQDHRLFQRIAT